MNLKPIEVACTRCRAQPGERCSTDRAGRASSPHAPRVLVAMAAVPCGSCGAGLTEHCRNSGGRPRLRICTGRRLTAGRARRQGR